MDNTPKKHSQHLQTICPIYFCMVQLFKRVTTMTNYRERTDAGADFTVSDFTE